MKNSTMALNPLLNKVLFWSAKLLTIAAILLLGKANEVRAEKRASADDGNFAVKELCPEGQMSYVMVEDIGEDWKDDPLPVIE